MKQNKSKKNESLALESSARLFRALGDEARLKLLVLISEKELTVTEISEVMEEAISTISQRLKLLRQEGLVKRRRDGKNFFYSLIDSHIKNLISNAIEHAME
jgi:ArsR family transcriptional regulator, lead/cadmium/zinc/bismuth-responsive transcriptional repressor